MSTRVAGQPPRRRPSGTAGNPASRRTPREHSLREHSPREMHRDHVRTSRHGADNVVDLREARLARAERLDRERRRDEHEAQERRQTLRELGILKEVEPVVAAAVEEEETVEAGRKAAKNVRDEAPTRKAACPPCHRGLAVLCLLMTILSVPLVYSASTAIALNHHDQPEFFLWRQMGYAVAGLLFLWAASRISGPQLRVVVWGCFAITVLGLLATDFTPLGLVLGGVRRWAKLGPVQFQFSELAKIALIGVMADFWSRAAQTSSRAAWPWFVTAGITLPVVGLVFAQPHLSAASLLFILPFFIAFFAGASLQNMAKILVPLALCVVFTVFLCQKHQMPFLKTYQQDRIASHFSSDGEEQRDGNYQVMQGQRALMRGGIFGTGPGGSIYKQGHLPAPHTDFILAAIGEEWGLVGMLALLTMYGLLIFFCFHTGHCATNSFDALLCAGIGTLIAVQSLCNISVVTGVLPVTGMPLPLLSYGGSGLICTLLGLGLVLSVSRRYGNEEVAPKRGEDA